VRSTVDESFRGAKISRAPGQLTSQRWHPPDLSIIQEISTTDMPRDESKSPAPTRPEPPERGARRRSRSPKRDPNRPRRKEGGFNWKEKRRPDDVEQDRDGDGRLERGYKEHYRARSPHRGRDADDPELQARKDELSKQENKEKKERKEKKEKKAAAAPVSGEPMIIVNVNDRLGTKAAIPCFASDPISQHRMASLPVNPG
jgi:hypothetical protein